MDIIQAKDLTHDYIKYDEEERPVSVRHAIEKMDLSVKEGQFVVILGHNGSGKSTLAKHINALLLPTTGTVYVGGMDTADEANLWEIRQLAGMVFQNPDNQIIATVVEEDVAFGPENMGVPTEELEQRVKEALKTVGMSDHAKDSPNKLSGGQKQRIAIAGALAMKPRCIVFDESTAMLDPSGRSEVVATMHRLNREEGITILLITHYMDEAVGADRVSVLNDGQIAMDGTPKEIFARREELTALGMQLPKVTELADTLAAEGLDLPTPVLTVEELVEELCRLHSKN